MLWTYGQSQMQARSIWSGSSCGCHDPGPKTISSLELPKKKKKSSKVWAWKLISKSARQAEATICYSFLAVPHHITPYHELSIFLGVDKPLKKTKLIKKKPCGKLSNFGRKNHSLPFASQHGIVHRFHCTFKHPIQVQYLLLT